MLRKGEVIQLSDAKHLYRSGAVDHTPGLKSNLKSRSVAYHLPEQSIQSAAAETEVAVGRSASRRGTDTPCGARK